MERNSCTIQNYKHLNSQVVHTHFSGVAIKRLQFWFPHVLIVNIFNSVLLSLCNFHICISWYFYYTLYETWADSLLLERD